MSKVQTVELENGKYELRLHEESGALCAYRNGEPWQDFSGNKFVYLLMQEVLNLREAVRGLREAQAEPVAYTSERHFALREAHGYRSEEDYFTARPNLDGPDERIAFRAGFVRGFDAGEQVYAAPPSPAQAASGGEVVAWQRCEAACAAVADAARRDGLREQAQGADDCAASIRVLAPASAPPAGEPTVPVPTVVSWSGGPAPYRFVRLQLDDTPTEYEYVPAGDPPAPAAAREVVEALQWYGEQARLCRLIHEEGNAGRHALAADGGQRARAALSTQPPADKPL